MNGHGTPHSVIAGKQYSPPKKSNTLRVDITRTYAMWPRRVFLQWLVRDPSPNTSYVFNVYRSGSSEGDWEPIGVNLINDYFFVDEEFGGAEKPDLYSMSRTLYYKITVAGSDGSSGVIEKKMEPWNDRRHAGIHRKLVRDAYIALKVAMGTEVAILKRLHWGTLCSCLSSTGQPTVAHCPLCYGTTFVGGYWNPVYTYAFLGSRPVSVQVALQGHVETKQTTAIMPYVPQVEYEDVIVFLRSGKRYTIKEVNPTQIHNVDVHQELVVSELATSSVEYNIPVGPWLDPCWWRT